MGDDPRTAQKKKGKKSGTRRCFALAIEQHLRDGSPPEENFLVVWVVVFLLSASLVVRSVVLVLGAVFRPSCRVWSSGLVVCFRLPGLFLSVFQKEATTQGTDPRTGLSEGRRPKDRSSVRYPFLRTAWQWYWSWLLGTYFRLYLFFLSSSLSSLVCSNTPVGASGRTSTC